MNCSSEKRNYDRFPIELEVEVIGTDSEGRKFLEKTLLKDVSGGGTSFVPHLIGNYFTGQELGLKILLPGTFNLSACLEGNARVVRIIKGSEYEIDKGADTKVAVILDDPLQLKFSE